MRQLERRGCYLRSFSILPSFLSPGGRLFLPARRDIWPCSSVGRAPQQSCGGNGSIPFKASVHTHLSRVHLLLTPRKDGERSKGHGADCGKTLYRRLTVLNYAPEKGKGHPVCSTGSVGGCNDPQQAGNRLFIRRLAVAGDGGGFNSEVRL